MSLRNACQPIKCECTHWPLLPQVEAASRSAHMPVGGSLLGDEEEGTKMQTFLGKTQTTVINTFAGKMTRGSLQRFSSRKTLPLSLSLMEMKAGLAIRNSGIRGGMRAGLIAGGKADPLKQDGLIKRTERQEIECGKCCVIVDP